MVMAVPAMTMAVMMVLRRGRHHGTGQDEACDEKHKCAFHDHNLSIWASSANLIHRSRSSRNWFSDEPACIHFKPAAAPRMGPIQTGRFREGFSGDGDGADDDGDEDDLRHELGSLRQQKSPARRKREAYDESSLHNPLRKRPLHP